MAVLNASGEGSVGADVRGAASKTSSDGGVVRGSSSDIAAPNASDSVGSSSPDPASPTPVAPAPPAASVPDAGAGQATAGDQDTSQQDGSSESDLGQVGPGSEDPGSEAPLPANSGAESLVAAARSLVALPLATALPRAGSPFAWKFTSTGPDTCRIDGYQGTVPTGPSASVSVPATVLIGDVPKKVTSIQRSSFDTFRSLSCHVDFSTGTNLQRIEDGTFQQSQIKGSLDLPDSLTYVGQQAFQDCPNVNSVKLPVNPGFTKIQSYSFLSINAGAGSLSGTLVIPASVISIGDSAFKNNRLTGLQFAPGSKLPSISASAFQGNQIGGVVSFPESLTTFWDKCFEGNRITEARFGKNPVALRLSCFENNRIAHDPLKGYKFNGLGSRCFAGNLIDSVDFSGDQSTFPGNELLANNPKLVSAVLSPSWTRLPGGLFKNNSGLVNVTFPPLAPGKRPALQNITSEAFQGCTALTSIDFKDAPLQDSVNGIAIGERAFQGCTSLQEVILGSKPVVFDPPFVSRNITVQADAFQGCTSLKTAIIPPSPSTGHVYYHIGARAFKDTDLGDYANSPGAIPGVPLGTLPLMGREIVDIGAQAYQNANLKDVWLPSSLKTVGDEAFADNHMGTLTLPQNSALDAPGAVGQNILARQRVEGSAYYGDVNGNKASVMLEGIQTDFGAAVSHLTSLTVRPAGGGPAVLPDNGDWTSTGKATFGLSDLDAPGAALNYGLGVWRKGGAGPLSEGSVTVPRIEEGVPFEFQFYDDAGFSSFDQSAVQWIAVGSKPKELLNNVPNFGLNKPGYRTQSGAYDPVSNAGWRWASTPNTGTPADPASVTAVKGTAPAFYNRWLSNSYDVAYDGNFAHMYDVDSSLGKPDPGKPGSFLPEPNPDLVFGSLPGEAGLAYGTAAPLPENRPPASAADPQGKGFKMGGYQFVGWATSPDLPEASRREGSNFFSPGAQIATPDPAPADGGTVTLYAQWKAKDLTQDPLVTGSVMIPARIQMQQDGAHLWSASPDAAYLSSRGFPDAASLPAHAVPVWAAQGGPGASWPAGIRYQVFVKRSASGAALLSLVGSNPEADPAIHAVDVLAARDGAPYDPGPDAAAPSVPLMELAPSDQAVASGLFYLRSQDKPWDFASNASYAGTMTFVLKQVGP